MRPTDRSSTEALIAQIVARSTRSPAGESPAAVGVGIPSVVEFETGPRALEHQHPARRRAAAHACSASGSACRSSSTTTRPSPRSPRPTTRAARLRRALPGDDHRRHRHRRRHRDRRARLPRRDRRGRRDRPHARRDRRGDPRGRRASPSPGRSRRWPPATCSTASPREAAAAHPDSALGRLLAAQRLASPGPTRSPPRRPGDAVAIDCVATLGRRLGIGVANAINTFDPEVVAIGGGVSSAGELLLGPRRAAALEYVLPGVGTATTIRIARSGPQAGVRGAALLARSELNSHHGEAR